MEKARDKTAMHKSDSPVHSLGSCGEQLRWQKAVEQKDLLKEAMEELSAIAPTREKFAELIGVSKRGLDKWLFDYVVGKPKQQQDFREMPESVRRLLIVMLEHPDVVERMQFLAHEYKRNLHGQSGCPAGGPVSSDAKPG